jgi:hypothetical protein
VSQLRVGRVRDRVDLERGHVRLHHLQLGHAANPFALAVDLACCRSSSS